MLCLCQLTGSSILDDSSLGNCYRLRVTNAATTATTAAEEPGSSGDSRREEENIFENEVKDGDRILVEKTVPIC